MHQSVYSHTRVVVVVVCVSVYGHEVPPSSGVVVFRYRVENIMDGYDLNVGYCIGDANRSARLRSNGSMYSMGSVGEVKDLRKGALPKWSKGTEVDVIVNLSNRTMSAEVNGKATGVVVEGIPHDVHVKAFAYVGGKGSSIRLVSVTHMSVS